MVVLEGKGLSRAMNARMVGSGAETLVLAHGYGMDQSLWDNVVPGLADKYRVVVFDWNFSGASAARADPLNRFDPVKYSSLDAYSKDLVDLMEEMGLKECVLVGHSMSGMIGCIASILRPDLFKHLILIGASPRYLNAEEYEGGFGREDVEQIFSAIEANLHGWASAFSTAIVGEDDPASIEKVEGCLKSMTPEVAEAVAKLIFLGDYRDRLKEVLTPCTLVKTNNDLAMPDSVACYMKRTMKAKSNIEVVNVNGHFPMLTAPFQLIDVIDRAMASQSSN